MIEIMLGILVIASDRLVLLIREKSNNSTDFEIQLYS